METKPPDGAQRVHDLTTELVYELCIGWRGARLSHRLGQGIGHLDGDSTADL